MLGATWLCGTGVRRSSMLKRGVPGRGVPGEGTPPVPRPRLGTEVRGTEVRVWVTSDLRLLSSVLGSRPSRQHLQSQITSI